MSAEDEIKNYAIELGVSTLTVTSLITSHRRLREWNVEYMANRDAEMRKARDFATQQALEEVKNGLYISIEQLKSMTLAEIAEYVHQFD